MRCSPRKRHPYTERMNEPVVTIVVAAGSGVRLGGDGPKALRELDGVPLVRRSVDALAAGGCTRAIVVISAADHEGFVAALAGAPIPVVFVEGGERRQDSVRNGLLAVADEQIVLVHDAARPNVPPAVVERVIAAVQAGADAVVPVVDVVDSVRLLTADGSAVLDRSTVKAVQTPQGFRRSALLEAHAVLVDSGAEVTDDAAACELAGFDVTLVEGAAAAAKITTPIDLLVAEQFLTGGH